MSDVLSTFSTRRTPQSQPRIPDQVRNAAGGFAYRTGDELRLHRFLTLGTDGGTYYTNARDLTKDNAEVVLRMVADKGLYTVSQIVEISTAGRAPKNKQALFALALAASHGDDVTRAAALAALPQVARTATHLFEFLNYAQQFRGWGKGLQKAVLRWYADKPVDRAAYQMVKYRQREGWTHADVLRKAHRHIDGVTGEHAALFNWAVGRREGLDIMGNRIEAELPAIVGAFEALQAADSVGAVVRLIEAGHGITWEMVPDQFLNQFLVWEALLSQGVPQTALMRQLPRLTRIGLTTGATGRAIVEQLTDAERLKKARVHPINVLVAQRTYAQGYSERGSSTWTPDRKITDALDAAFYAAFGAVEPANKRTLLALDVSGSMGSRVSGLPISCREASGALAMVIAATEPDTEIVGFTSGGWSSGAFRNRGWRSGGLSKLDLSPRRRLDDNLRAISNLPFGGTDCALPLVWAKETKAEFDTFQIYTDNETWAGNIHVDQALEQYRQSSGIDARVEIVSMTATGTSLCNPDDPGMLDVSGFDSTVPQLLTDHSAGRI
ncbi:Ro-like RNA binding protein [Mycobacterium phage ArcherS7]|uniref:Ro-like RNA binding protein n=23 Tax=Bixzunavirus TaxID=680114 RepID=Q852Y5_BPMBZ|nr:RNA-binding protein [Mycobacterium phage Bxz1]YP_002224222.1 RNA-binding protein [Mycobacterium phage ScottMcG]YP_002224445.1 RNA-binding protein [Mycobacterium phage Spud]YP_002224886.1 RNA-binding protein [Mycobacterium phage Rizal]YP_008061003.1 RNA-binding protein [Mycobacterium phage Gizmo]YP_008061461.1 RNA-binding protein [Mycobacterium phage ArcherS7]YP_008061691.1 RNA-binding protein [Mycobacterium phage Astraea]YP_009017531.1 RNA-binding protein [Mycobacterium phage MoMoMixon]Y